MLLVLTLPVCCCALLKLNLLYMYFFKYYYYYPCVALTFPLNGIKKYLTIITIKIIVIVMITKWL